MARSWDFVAGPKSCAFADGHMTQCGQTTAMLFLRCRTLPLPCGQLDPVWPDGLGDIRLELRSSNTTEQARKEDLPSKETLAMAHNPSHAGIIADDAYPACLSLEPTPISAFTAQGATTRWIRNYNGEDISSPKIRWSSSAVSSNPIAPWTCPRARSIRNVRSHRTTASLLHLSFLPGASFLLNASSCWKDSHASSSSSSSIFR